MEARRRRWVGFGYNGRGTRWGSGQERSGGRVIAKGAPRGHCCFFKREVRFPFLLARLSLVIKLRSAGNNKIPLYIYP